MLDNFSMANIIIATFALVSCDTNVKNRNVEYNDLGQGEVILSKIDLEQKMENALSGDSESAYIVAIYFGKKMTKKIFLFG
jgi:hypothetical protein